MCVLSYGQKPRARDLGVPFVGTTGEFNAITDVKGVEVGYSTIISGEGENIIGKGSVRTGVTAIFPRGKAKKFSPVYAKSTQYKMKEKIMRFEAKYRRMSKLKLRYSITIRPRRYDQISRTG
jgi:hypothetical protein